MRAVSLFSFAILAMPGHAVAQTLTTLYAFNAGDAYGGPTGSLLYQHDDLFGTTPEGGGLGCSGTGCGTAFRVNATTGAARLLHRFVLGRGGGYPMAGLTAFNGLLYGTTQYGGANSGGTVFSLNPDNRKYAVIYRFHGKNDGASPMASLLAMNNLLYGTTIAGGANDAGTAFAIDPATNTETVLYSFQSGTDGAIPEAGLIAVSGTLYGTSLAGGGTQRCGGYVGCGTIFAINPATGAETVLHAFTGGSDGAGPAASLVYANGALYGTTITGGGRHCNTGCGTVFKYDLASATESVLFSFKGHADGAYPYATLVFAYGRLYGTTVAGGAGDCGNGCGTIFAVNGTSGAHRVLYRFSGADDGANPSAGLIKHAGIFYGTTTSGGADMNGTVFAFRL